MVCGLLNDKKLLTETSLYSLSFLLYYIYYKVIYSLVSTNFTAYYRILLTHM